MTLRLVPVANFNNPNLPILDFKSPIFRDGALRVYDMLSAEDLSGNNGHLVMSGHTFGPEGMVCTATGGQYADTGLTEPDAFTVLVCHNFSTPSGTPAVSAVLSSLAELATPFSGHRMALNSAGSLSLAVGKSPSPSFSVADGSASGGWTTYVYTLSGKDATIRRADGQLFTNSMAAGDTRNPATSHLYVAGNPATATGDTGGLDLPPSGTFGCLGIYPGVFTSSQQVQLMLDAQKLMARRGVTVSVTATA